MNSVIYSLHFISSNHIKRPEPLLPIILAFLLGNQTCLPSEKWICRFYYYWSPRAYFIVCANLTALMYRLHDKQSQSSH